MHNILLPFQNDITQINQKSAPSHSPPFSIQGHILFELMSQLRAFFETFFVVVVDSWGAFQPCVKLIRRLARRINMWRICLFSPAALHPPSLICKQGDMEVKLLSAMWLKWAPKEELASRSMPLLLKNLIWVPYTLPKLYFWLSKTRRTLCG